MKTWRTIANTNNDIKSTKKFTKKSLFCDCNVKRRGNKIVAFIPSAVIQSTIKSVMVFVCKIISLLLFHLFLCYVLDVEQIFAQKNTAQKWDQKLKLPLFFSHCCCYFCFISFYICSRICSVLANFFTRLTDLMNEILSIDMCLFSKK